MRLLILNTEEPTFDSELPRSVAEGFAAVLGRENVVLARYENACATFQKTGCNASLLLGGRGMRTPVVKELLRLSPIKILWTIGDPDDLPLNAKHAAWFDFIFTNDRNSPAAYGDRAVFLPLGAADCPDEPPPMASRYRDVFFSGVAWPEHRATIEQLTPQLVGLKTQFWFPAERGVARPQLPMPRHEWDVRVSDEDVLTAARYSKIVLNFDREGAPSHRLFDVAAVGAAQVTLVTPDAIAPYFEPGEEIITASTADEAAKTIRALLAEPDRLEAIGQASRRRAMADHSYASRAQTIVDHIAEKEANGVATHCFVKTAALRPLNVLLVASDDATGACRSDAVHVEHILAGLKHQFDFHVLRFHHHGKRRVLVHRNSAGNMRVIASTRSDPARSWVVSRLDAAFQKLLLAEDIDIVHFCDLQNASLGFVQVARSLGRPTLFDLHDYAAACPRTNLIDYRGEFCGLPTMATCDECLRRTMGTPFGSQLRRRDLMAAAFRAVDRIQFVSERQRSLLNCVLPFRLEKTLVQEVGATPAADDVFAEQKLPLQAAIFGDFDDTANADVLLGVMRRLSAEPIHFTIIGRVDPHYRSGVAKLVKAKKATVFEPRNAEETFTALKKMHVAVFASRCPPPALLGLSESLRAGLVPVAIEAPEFAARIRNRENGLLVAGDIGSFVDSLMTLLDNPSLLQKLHAGALAESVTAIDQELRTTETVYHELAEQYHLATIGRRGRTSPIDADSLQPISVQNVGSQRTFPQKVASKWETAKLLYRTHGVGGVMRRTCEKLGLLRRSA